MIEMLLALQLGLNPLFYKKTIDYEQIKVDVFAKHEQETHGTFISYKVDNIVYKDVTRDESKSYLKFWKSYQNFTFVGTYRNNSSRDEHAISTDIGYKSSRFPFIEVLTGYVGSQKEDFYNMAALKFNIGMFKYHMRTDFKDRPYEWWFEGKLKFKTAKKWLHTQFKLQLDNQNGSTDREIAMYLVLGGTK